MPQALNKKVGEMLDIGQGSSNNLGKKGRGKQKLQKVAEPSAVYQPKSAKEFEQQVKKLEQQMYQHAQNLEFEQAAAVRDELHKLRERFIFEE